jgi:hypothetical protein
MKRLLIGLALLISVCSYGQTQIGVFKLTQCPLYNIISLTVPPSNVTNSLYAINHQLMWEGSPVNGGSGAGAQVWAYELGTDYQTTFTVSFPLKTTSQVAFNGKILRNFQWSGAGTSTLTLSLDTHEGDFISIVQ